MVSFSVLVRLSLMLFLTSIELVMFKQPTVFHSSTEAEYQSLAQIVAELSWLQMLLTDRGLSSNSVFHAHSNISAD